MLRWGPGLRHHHAYSTSPWLLCSVLPAYHAARHADVCPRNVEHLHSCKPLPARLAAGPDFKIVVCL